MLVEINPGLWLRPERVSMVTALRGTDQVPASVAILIDGDRQTGWQFEEWQDAVKFAGRIAAAVNAALRGEE